MASFGEHVTYDQIKLDFILGEIQSGTERKIDTVQLEEKLQTIKLQPVEIARKLAHIFPDISILKIDSQEVKDKKLEFLSKNINDFLFVYMFTDRWFNYFIGDTRIADVVFSRSSLFSKIQEKTGNVVKVISNVHT